MSDLSIVVASYEAASALEACLDSIEAAQRDGLALALDVIVVDDGSRDDSVERARNSPLAPRLVATRRNRGFAAAMNTGMRLARGRHVLLLNSDAEVDRALLEAAVARLDADAEIGVLAPALVHSDGRPQRSVHALPGLATELFPEPFVRVLRRWSGASLPAFRDGACQAVEAVRGAVFFIRGSIIEKVGELDEGFFFFLEDTDFCARVRDAGHRVVWCSDLRARHALGASSKRRTPLVTRIEYHRSLYRFLRRRSGHRVVTLVRVVRLLRNVAAVLFLSVAGCFSSRLRERAAQRWGLVLWHLRGCPAEPTLARASSDLGHFEREGA